VGSPPFRVLKHLVTHVNRRQEEDIPIVYVFGELTKEEADATEAIPSQYAYLGAGKTRELSKFGVILTRRAFLIDAMTKLVTFARFGPHLISLTKTVLPLYLILRIRW